MNKSLLTADDLERLFYYAQNYAGIIGWSLATGYT